MSKFNRLERMVESSSSRARRVNEAGLGWRLLGGEYDNIDDLCHDIYGMSSALKELVDDLNSEAREVVDDIGNVRLTTDDHNNPSYAFQYPYLRDYIYKFSDYAEHIFTIANSLVALKKKSSRLRTELWDKYTRQK